MSSRKPKAPVHRRENPINRTAPGRTVPVMEFPSTTICGARATRARMTWTDADVTCPECRQRMEVFRG